MPTDTEVSQLVINTMTEDQYVEKANADQVSDTELYLTDDTDDYVTTNTIQDITAEKSFISDSSRTTPVVIRCIDLDTSVTPSTSQWRHLEFYDKNYVRLGALEINQDTNNNHTIQIVATNPSNVGAALSVSVKADGSKHTYAPPAAGVNSIVTTITASNTGVKLGNGYIINWGFGATNATCTFAVPFSNTNYVVALASDSSGGFPYYSAKTTTNFKMTNHSGTYIAIGK